MRTMTSDRISFHNIQLIQMTGANGYPVFQVWKVSVGSFPSAWRGSGAGRRALANLVSPSSNFFHPFYQIHASSDTQFGLFFFSSLIEVIDNGMPGRL